MGTLNGITRNEPIAIGEMSSQIMPVHCHLTMARALKGNDIPIFGSIPHRSSWGFVMCSWERVTNP